MWSYLKRDIGEFVSTIKDDATVTIKSVMALGDEASGDDSYYDSDIGASDDTELLRRRQRHQPSAALRAMRADITTYTEDVPEAESERYASFVKTFDIRSKTQDIATLLEESEVISQMHTQLVPEHITYDTFWSRYFFRAERLIKGDGVGGISFPDGDEEEDEDFGWGEDDQDEQDEETEDSPGRPSEAAPALTAGGALGAMHTSATSGSAGVEGDVSGDSPVLAPEEDHSTTTAATQTRDRAACEDGSAGVEVARVAEALRVSELKRRSLTSELAAATTARGDDESSDRSQRLEAERDNAVAEAKELRTRLSTAEKERDDALARVAELVDATSHAERRTSARVQELQEDLAASDARVKVAEEKAHSFAATRKEAEAEAEDSDASTGNAAEAHAAVAAAAEAHAAVAAAAAAQQEISRMKMALREERMEHETMLRASRQAAKEAVEAALSSADVDREEACAELAASMQDERRRKDEELEAFRAQLAKSSAAMEEAGTLKDEVAELRQAVASEREASRRAASEARQEADVTKQLREEIRVLRAAAEQRRAVASSGRSAGVGTTRRAARSDIVSEDTDGWGEDEDDSCCAESTNSSGVVVEQPSSRTTSPGRHDGLRRPRGQASGGPGGAGFSGSEESGIKEGDGEGEDGWEGWD